MIEDLLVHRPPRQVRYPIGDFGLAADVTPAKRRLWIRHMDELPRRLTVATAGLSDAQLETSYRDGGWTPKQVVHHLTDAHLNGFARFKLALTDDTPAIKTHDDRQGEQALRLALPPPHCANRCLSRAPGLVIWYASRPTRTMRAVAETAEHVLPFTVKQIPPIIFFSTECGRPVDPVNDPVLRKTRGR